MDIDLEPSLLSVFQALADPTRLRLLHLLADGETCVGDLVAAVDLPQGTVSRHLGALRAAELVRCRRSGVWAYYQLSPAARQSRPLGKLIHRAARQLPTTAADQERWRHIQQQGGCC